jgi:hypothetical protein
MEHSKTTLGPRNLFAQSAHPIGDERLAKALALARENTAWALLHRLEVGRLEDLLRWIGTNAETDWLQLGKTQQSHWLCCAACTNRSTLESVLL